MVFQIKFPTLSIDRHTKNYTKQLISYFFLFSWEDMLKHLDPARPPPMEKLIRLAPEIAEMVLKKCVRKEVRLECHFV